MKQSRALNKEEIDLIEYLARKAKYPLSKYWYNEFKASPMDDGGMGSILLIPNKLLQHPRMFKAQISDCLLKDTDGIAILISLNIDQNNCLFELDIWKSDYSSVTKICGLQELQNPLYSQNI